MDKRCQNSINNRMLGGVSERQQLTKDIKRGLDKISTGLLLFQMQV